MEESAVVFYAACITMALQHLHSHGIVYRDLKSENVLLTGGFSSPAAGWPVLADFGLANFSKNDHNLTTFCGTAAFIAPEVAASAGYGTAADWWSLGILICQCLTLTTPFEGPNPRATIDNVLHGRRVGGPILELERAAMTDVDLGDSMAPPQPPGDGDGEPEISPRAAKMIDALLQSDPAERLGGPLRGGEVRVQPFFWGFDWASIERRQMTPPHAEICRERAVTATKNPALQLPPLPKVKNNSSRRPSVEEPAVDTEEAAAAEVVAKQMAQQQMTVTPPAVSGGNSLLRHQVEALQSMPGVYRGVSGIEQAENFLGEEEDLADFI